MLDSSVITKLHAAVDDVGQRINCAVGLLPREAASLKDSSSPGSTDDPIRTLRERAQFFAADLVKMCTEVDDLIDQLPLEAEDEASFFQDLAKVDHSNEEALSEISSLVQGSESWLGNLQVRKREICDSFLSTTILPPATSTDERAPS